MLAHRVDAIIDDNGELRPRELPFEADEEGCVLMVADSMRPRYAGQSKQGVPHGPYA